MSSRKTSILFIHALTSLHPGSGTALGTVDLPVQRERHTGWPMIQSSTLKGVLRDACRPKNGDEKEKNEEEKNGKEENGKEKNEKEKWLAVFGPETADADAYAGALSLTDARLLAFPVRSLRGVFAWVSCKSVLDRLNRDLVLARELNRDLVSAEEEKKATENIQEVEGGQAICAQKSPLLFDNDKLVLEEFEFKRHGNAPFPSIAEWIFENAVEDAETKKRLRTNFVILSDNDFTHFVRYATEVVARIALDYETKTVKEKALFYEEYLPPETIFYSLVFADESHKKNNNKMSNKDILDYVKKNMPATLQIGAGETIGKGFCAVRLVDKLLSESSK